MSAIRTIRRLPGGLTVDTGLDPEKRRIPLDMIDVDKDYQRELSPSRIQMLRERWEEAACGAILLSQRKDGSLYCYDGQHRLETKKQLGHPDILSLIYTNLAIADEARLFAEANAGRGSLNRYSLFRARLVAKDQTALNIYRIINERGLHLVSANTARREPGSIWALAAVERIYDAGGDVGLRYILDTAVGLWPEEPTNCTAYVLMGLFRFWAVYKTRAELNWPNKLRTRTLESMTEDARRFATTYKSSVNLGFSRAVLAAVNHGKQNPLPDVFRHDGQWLAKKQSAQETA